MINVKIMYKFLLNILPLIFFLYICIGNIAKQLFNLFIMSDSVLNSLKSLVMEINDLNASAGILNRLRISTVVYNDGIDNDSKVYIQCKSFDIIDTKLILHFVIKHTLLFKVVSYHKFVRFVLL